MIHLYQVNPNTHLFFSSFSLFPEVVLVLLLEKIEFSLSDKDIVWQMNAIATPNVDMDSTTPTLPMKLSLADSKSVINCV